MIALVKRLVTERGISVLMPMRPPLNLGFRRLAEGMARDYRYRAGPKLSSLVAHQPSDSLQLKIVATSSQSSLPRY